MKKHPLMNIFDQKFSAQISHTINFSSEEIKHVLFFFRSASECFIVASDKTDEMIFYQEREFF